MVGIEENTDGFPLPDQGVFDGYLSVDDVVIHIFLREGISTINQDETIRKEGESSKLSETGSKTAFFNGVPRETGQFQKRWRADSRLGKASGLFYNKGMPSQFNTWTSYRFASSTILVEEYAKRGKELGYTSLAISDNNLYAFPSFADACQKEGIKALFGYEIHLGSSRVMPFTAYLYIKNEQGYRNLCEIIALREDVIGSELLKKYHEGLVLVISTNQDFFSTPYLSAISPDMLAYQAIFGEDFYFGIEIYSSLDSEEASTLYEYLQDHSYKSIAFPRVEYLRKNDAYKTALFDKARSKEKADSLPEEGPYFLLSPKALNSIYRKEDTDACDELADKLNFHFFAKRGEMISFPDDDETLRSKAEDGLKERLGGNVTEVYQKRLDYELSIIKDMHFSSYFLIVEDYVSFAKDTGIKVGPGRGSAGGSLVAYALKITEVDPIRFDLTFERFLNPYRKTMPDIDIDFIDTRRDEVAQYLKVKYGEKHTATIITFPRLKPKSCLNLIGPALGFNENRLKNLTREIDDKAETFEEAISSKVYGYRFQRLYNDPYYKEICDIAKSLLGLPYNTSIHAPGVIISKEEIYHTCPMSEGTRGTVGYEYPYMERMGFLKMDILSLSNLSFIEEIEKKVQSENKKLPDIYSDLDNPKVYETLNRLDLFAIFQLDTSKAMRKTVEEIHPNCFADMTSVIALCRPGPMEYIHTFAERKKGHEKVTYIDERLRPILEPTYGILVYQEQIMKVVQVIASFDLGEADLFRRAIAKKDLSKMEAYRSKFMDGCKKNGITEDKAEALFEDIEKFASYGFNKAHAYAYALITYTLLYYKTFYADEFYSAALKDNGLGNRKSDSLIKELIRNGYRIKNPDINRSLKDDYLFLPDKVILPPLSAVSGYQETIGTNIIEERRKKGLYASFYDFIKRYPKKIKNEDRFFLSLIDSGAFDSFSKSRLGMKNNLVLYSSYAQMGFLEKDLPPLNDDGEDIGEMLYLEKLALGRILSCPLKRIYSKSGYHTYFISDTSMVELSHIVVLEDEDSRVKLQLTKGEKPEKYSFVLVEEGYSYDRKKTFYSEADTRVVFYERKVVKHG